MAEKTSSTGSIPTRSEPWLFASVAAAMLALSLLLFAALRIFSGVFQQARDGAIEALLIQSAAIGVIVMASIQAVRSIVPVRSWFHRRRVSVWLGRAPDEFKKTKDFNERMHERLKNDSWLGRYIKPDTTEEEILHRLLQLTTAEGGDRPSVSRAFFDMPLEQLCGQISAGAERAIVNPRTNGDILLRLANAAGEDDVLSFFEAHFELDGEVADQDSNTSGPPPREQRMDTFTRARASVEERVRRSIDCLQIESGFVWRRRLRLLAVILAAALGLMAAFVASQFLASVPAAIASGIVGGFLRCSPGTSRPLSSGYDGCLECGHPTHCATSTERLSHPD